MNQFFIAFLFSLIGFSVFSQCSVDVGPSVVNINCGDSISFTAMGSGNVPLLITDFDNGAAGPGWLANGGAGFGQLCGPGNGTPYYWASTAVGTPALTTVGFDVSCGATVYFDMVYSAQGGPAPCEGPDLPDEGVTFEYSTDGGVTWTTIQYWDPNGGNDPMLTAWNTYTLNIPPAAYGPNTMFQWIQYNSSGSCCDNWGIDDVIIVPGLCGVNWDYDWSMIPGSPDAITQTVGPLTTTEYSVILTNGIDICYDTVLVIVDPLLADATTSLNALICPDCADLEVEFTNNNAGSIIDDFDPTIEASIWGNVSNGTAGGGCGSMSGNALHFDGTGTDRSITTVPINSTVCGMVNFCLFMGNSGSGGAPCENADANENVVFEYSINGGVTWTIITTYLQSLWDGNNNWQCFVLPIPPPAQTTATLFRWRQTAFSSCAGCDNWALDNVNIACSPPIFDYDWSPAAGLSDPTVQAPIACPLVPTTYTAVITDPATGCAASDSVFIDVLCSCTIHQLTMNISQCENGNSFTVSGDFEYIENPGSGTLEIEITNASGTYTQTIPGPFTNSLLTNYSINGIIADGSPVTVDVYFSDELTCTAQVSGVSPVLPEVTNFAGGAIYCPGDAVADLLVDVTGNGPFTINYTLDGVNQSVVAAGPVINLGSIEGVYDLISIDDQGCTNTAIGSETISLQVVPTVVSLTGGSEYCENEVVADVMVGVTGTGPWTVDYAIDGVNYSMVGVASPISLGNQEGVYQLIEVSDANCSDLVNNTDEIIINPAPNVVAGVDFISCENDPIVLTAVGAQSFLWDNGVSNGVSFVPLVTTTYTVIGTDPNGCQDTDDITVIIEPLPMVSFSADQTIGCEPFPVIFTNTTSGALVDCQWEFGDGGTASGCGDVPTIYMNGGLYDVTLTTTSSNGCINSVTYNDFIYVESNPMASFIPSSQQVLSLDTEVLFDNTTSGAVNYVWDFGDNSPLSTEENPIHEFPGEQTNGYYVTLYAYSPLGCVDSTVTVIQVNEEVIFYIPNTFTPDGDEFNQNFQPVFTAGFDPFDFNMLIYNRWGEVIFETNNPEAGWDGTYHGKIVSDGTYTWRVEFKTMSSDERMVVHGHLNVIR